MDYENELITQAPKLVETESNRAVKEAFDWVAKNISSCRNSFHLKGCERLIDLFQEVYKPTPAMIESLYRSLYVKEIMISIP